MKKTFYTLAFTSLFAVGASAQSINNGGFENWTSGEPDGWSTINSNLAIASVPANTTEETSDVHSGNSAAKLESVSVLGFASAPAIVAIADINVAIAMPPSISITPGAAFAARPDSLVGFYKYTNGGSDAFGVSAVLTKWHTGTGTRDTIGSAEFINAANVTAYTRFFAQFTYQNSDIPDSLTLVISSSAYYTAAVAGSVALVDDVTVHTGGGSMSIAEIVASNEVKLFPNPASSVVTLSNLTVGDKLTMLDMTGKVVLNLNVQNSTQTIDVSAFRSGVYVIKGKTFSRRLVINE